jgi:hypothetical protein
LYSYLKKVPVTDITISFIESWYPKKLISYLKVVRKYTVEKTDEGIYTIQGDAFAMQIIDSRYLSNKENLWLKNLRGKLEAKTIDRVITEAEKQDKIVNLGAYIDVLSRANEKKFREVLKMRAPTLKEIIYGYRRRQKLDSRRNCQRNC